MCAFNIHFGFHYCYSERFGPFFVIEGDINSLIRKNAKNVSFKSYFFRGNTRIISELAKGL